MSTKITIGSYSIPIDSQGDSCKHLHFYHEMHDDCYHLEIYDDCSHSCINVVIPENFVDLLKSAIIDSETGKHSNKLKEARDFSVSFLKFDGLDYCPLYEHEKKVNLYEESIKEIEENNKKYLDNTDCHLLCIHGDMCGNLCGEYYQKFELKDS